MTRLAILAILAAGALLAWLNVRDLIHRHRYCYCSGDPQERHRVCCGGTPHRADPMDAVQADPWPTSVRDNLAPALDPDPPYLEALPLARMRRAYGGNPLANT